MAYKALFIDFDNTLYYGGGKISQANTAAIKKAVAVGKKISICTGRSYVSLSYYDTLLGLDMPGYYGVGLNGGMVYTYDKTGIKVLHQQIMERKTALEILEIMCGNAKIKTYAYGEDNELYSTSEQSGDFNEERRLKIRGIKSFEEMPIEIAKIISIGENEILGKMAEKIRYNSVFSARDCLEFTPKGVDKGRGLQYVAELLNIPLAKIIAVGDAANDAPMLKLAGLGIAVANASDAAKAAADIVYHKSCDEDAVADIINKYLL